MKKTAIILGLFSLLLVCLTGCEKDQYKEMVKELVGKWKLSDVTYMDTRVILDGEYWHPDIEYPTNITYDFLENNKLVVTYFISGELQKEEYYYSCKKANYHPWAESKDACSVHLHIGNEVLLCVVNPKYKSVEASLWIGQFNPTMKAIDEVDLVMMEYDFVSSWAKSFNKLK